MRNVESKAACVIALLAAAAAGAQQPQPSAGSSGLYVGRQQLEAALRSAIATHPELALAAIGVTDQYIIHEVYRDKGGVPAIHMGWTELHFILDGRATLVIGGKIVPDAGKNDAAIEGGVTRVVNRGDAIIIPPDTPHWYKSVNGSITYLEVRFPMLR